MSARSRAWLSALLIVGVSVASYVTVLRFAGWIWDDPDYVLNNPNLWASGGLGRIWFDPSATPQYYPMVHTSFWLEYQLVGSGVPGDAVPPTLFHVDNVLLFAATAFLFWRVLRRLQVPGALAAALLFAAHPVNVESVAWVTERKNTLSGFFAMLTVLGFLRFARFGANASERPAWGWLVPTLLCWTCGLFAKTTIAFLPPALFLIHWWRRPAAALRPAIVLPLLVMLVPGVLAGLHTKGLETTLVGVTDAHFPELGGWLDRLLLAGTVVWGYLLHVLVPLEQMFFYPKWDPSPSSWWQWGLLLAAVGVPLLLYQLRGRIGRGPVVGVLIFGGALVPVMGFVNVYPMRFSWIADHFQYHANFALFALLGALCALCARGLRGRVGCGVFGLLLLGLVILSNVHGRAFADSESLYRATLAKNPDVRIAWENLGVALARKARRTLLRGDRVGAGMQFSEAHECYRRALALERDANLVRTVANFYTNRYLRERDPKDLDRAEALAIEGKGTIQHANVLFFRGGAHLPRAIELFEASVQEALADPRQAEYRRDKLMGSLRMILEKLAVCYLRHGAVLLERGDAAAALDLWSRPRRPWGGPGTEPWNELYPWPLRGTSRWFALELHRIWLLAAAKDAEVRDPDQALTEVAALRRLAPQKFAAGGVNRGTRDRAMLVLLDVEAAARAVKGDFDAAGRTVERLLSEAERLGYRAKTWLGAVAERGAGYRERRAFWVREGVSLPARYGK